MPYRPKQACPVCRRLDCTEKTHRKWYADRQRRPMTNAEIEHNRRAVAEWVGEHGPVCSACGTETEDLTADHLIPVSKGGDQLGPVRVICRRCNSQRGNKTVL